MTSFVRQLIPSKPASAGSGTASSRDVARWTFIALAVALLPLLVLTSFDFGVTWDEKPRHRYGEDIWEFFGGTRTRAQFPETGGHLYGGLFDVICVGVERLVPVNRYVIRHAINAAFGWIGIVYCGRLAARLFGTWTGVLAMVLLAASPRYFADSMNNPKDIPFAALCAMSLYYISTVSPRWPYLSWTTAAKIAVALALALNVRVGALLYLGYLGLLLIGFAIRDRMFDVRRLAVPVLRLAALTIAVFLLGTLFWPWAQGAPFINPIRALLGVANFPYGGTVLFAGRDYGVSELPWYYVPWWFAISTPPVVLAGLVLSLTFSVNGKDAHRRLALWSVGLFPLAVTLIMGSTLYDGIRHLLFTYPIVVVLAAAGWSGIILHRRASWTARAASVALVFGLADVTVFDVRFHPNQGVYFNALVSGPAGAFGRYDMDYWGNCVLQAVEWSADTARSVGMPLAISGNPPHLVQLDSERFRELYYTEPQRRQHYLHVRLARGPAESVRALAREPALHQVKTPDGAVLCNVVPGPRFDEMERLRSQITTRRSPSLRQGTPVTADTARTPSDSRR